MTTRRTVSHYYKKAWRATLAAGAMLCIFSSGASAIERQYKVEAAYLYSLFNYITWPGYASPQALETPVICIYGDDTIATYLDYIRARVRQERALTVRTVMDTQAGGCHMLFVRHRLPARTLNTLPSDVLVVFKPDDPLDRGGMIELFEDGERISILIDQQQLQQNGFKVSSRLLDLVQRVR